MEFNLELAINAGLANLNTAEVPIQLRSRKGESKLRTIRDGWRSLRMMLLYCLNKVFIIPGFIVFMLGLIVHIISLTGAVRFEGRPLAGVTGLFASILSVVGFQILSVGLHVKTYSWTRRFDKDNRTPRGSIRCFNWKRGGVWEGRCSSSAARFWVYWY